MASCSNRPLWNGKQSARQSETAVAEGRSIFLRVRSCSLQRRSGNIGGHRYISVGRNDALARCGSIQAGFRPTNVIWLGALRFVAALICNGHEWEPGNWRPDLNRVRGNGALQKAT